MSKPRKIELSDWDWTTLVAAWRYYEYGRSIGSATFPEEIVTRFFSPASLYSDNARKAIAHQFAKTDHGLRGEEDWTGWRELDDCDKLPWTKFYRFCEGYVDGFARVTFRQGGDGRPVEVEAFRVEWKGRWYPVEEYRASPWAEKYIPEEWIVRIEL